MAPPKVCAKCNEEVKGGWLQTADGSYYHPDCFKCTKCGEAMRGQFFESEDGSRVCQACAPDRKVCATCGEPMLGAIAEVGGKEYHPECFCCEVCELPITGTYYMKGDKLMCEPCVEGAAPVKPQLQKEAPTGGTSAFTGEADGGAGAAPPACQGYLYKKSPSRWRMSAYDWRYFSVRDSKLLWWKTQEEGQAPAASEENGGPLCKGVVDFKANPCEIEVYAGSPTMFLLKPKGGKWLKATFTGSDEGRAFEFDAQGSNHTRKEWMESFFAHINHATFVPERTTEVVSRDDEPEMMPTRARASVAAGTPAAEAAVIAAAQEAERRAREAEQERDAAAAETERLQAELHSAKDDGQRAESEVAAKKAEEDRIKAAEEAERLRGAAEQQEKERAAEAARIAAAEAAAAAAASDEPTYTMEQLTKKELWQELPINITKREIYLNEADFVANLGVSKAEFAAFPKWKQAKRKKEKGLF